MADSLEGASVHFVHLCGTILGWTKVKTAKLHIILKFTVMRSGRPLVDTPSSCGFPKYSISLGLLEVHKRAGSPF